MPYLIVIGGEARNVIHKVWDDGCLLGRGLVSVKHLAIDQDVYMSRREPGERQGHAEIRRNDRGEWVIRDLGSKNGTLYVSGRGRSEHLISHSSARLHHARLFSVGMSTMLFVDLEAPPGDQLIRELSRHEQAVRSSFDHANFFRSRAASTDTSTPNPGEIASIEMLWRHCGAVLERHGLGDLLGDA